MVQTLANHSNTQWNDHDCIDIAILDLDYHHTHDYYYMLDILEEIGEIVFGNKRLDSLRHFAEHKQFSIKRRHNPEVLPINVLSMEIFKQSRKKRNIKGMLWKQEPTLKVMSQIFDLIYYGDFGKKVTTIFLYEQDDMQLPQFIVKPKSNLSRISNLFSANDWSYVDKEFARSFSVETEEINTMQMILTLQFAEAMLNFKEYTVEGKGNHLIVYRRFHDIDIVDMDNVYQLGLELLDVILHDHSEEMI